ncbi:hypothetical protein CLNEO_05130 [Anaerotignum neopropionicum]|uniref:Uncharacterized protein n=1 Tax=Anaerotignum neopropionicum TaxID=36847 RepID=A0A136WIU7_9FIRM|nr:hypothetical protein [Anaerotignum neopropionicum]KXL54407.1 hypothetical protein CLNEO_05130 [Anaerotignum neopropionicum]
MTLAEANGRLRTVQINEEQLWYINSLYILLDLDKDDFCKIIDAVGLDKLLKKRLHYDRLLIAEEELSKKEKYIQAKQRLQEIAFEKMELEEVVNAYKHD